MITVAHVNEQKGLRGGERQASWLVRGLDKEGVKNIVIGRQGEPFIAMHPEMDNLIRIPLPLRGELDLYTAYQLARLAKRHRIDIFHAHSSHAHGLAVLATVFGAPARVVVSRRVNFMPKKHRLSRWKYHRAHRILCVSEVVHETLLAYGLPEERLKTVHSSVDMQRAMMPAVSRSSLGIPENVPFLFSAGALVSHKDHARLLEAFARVKLRFPTARLVIAGEGPLRKELETQIQTLGLETSVSLPGHCDEAPGICRSADLYVSSSWSEGLGTSILEALATGTPVVAAQAGGAAEMVVPGQTGRLVPVRDTDALTEAIIAALIEKDESLALAEAGKGWVEDKFSVSRMVMGTLETYRELV